MHQTIAFRTDRNQSGREKADLIDTAIAEAIAMMDRAAAHAEYIRVEQVIITVTPGPAFFGVGGLIDTLVTVIGTPIYLE